MSETVPIQSPPPAEQPPAPPAAPVDPAVRLRELAREFLRTRDRRLLYEYLRLRSGRQEMHVGDR